MNSIELLMTEHENVLRLTKVIRKACCKVLDGGDVVDEDFRQMIRVAREYADKYHHGKEEEILFVEMIDALGDLAEKLIRGGMLVEHDQGRFFLMQLEGALDRYKVNPTTEDKLAILVNAGGWADLLVRHAEKEDAVVYSFAQRALPEDVLAKVNADIAAFQEEHETAATELLAMLDRLEATYC